MSKLHIITLTWNACDKLTALKESLLPALKGIDYTWYIKDNASKDDTIQVASTWGQNIKIFPFKNNLQNFSQGVNYLVQQAQPKDDDLILLLNNDIIVNDATSIKSMIDLFNSDNKIGVVGARLLFTDSKKLQHAGVVFHPDHGGPFHHRLNESSDKLAEKNREFQVVTGAVLLTKYSYFKQANVNKNGIAGMDEDYHWAFDDVDLCLSIKYNLKKKIVYCGKTNFLHEESASLKKNPINKMFSCHNFNKLKNKWGSIYKLDMKDYSNPNHQLY